MTPEKLADAIAKANEFVKRAKSLQALQAEDQRVTSRNRASAAVRRSSMELTHSLADLRKPMT